MTIYIHTLNMQFVPFGPLVGCGEVVNIHFLCPGGDGVCFLSELAPFPRALVWELETFFLINTVE